MSDEDVGAYLASGAVDGCVGKDESHSNIAKKIRRCYVVKQNMRAKLREVRELQPVEESVAVESGLPMRRFKTRSELCSN